jgi:hypothetical protein
MRSLLFVCLLLTGCSKKSGDAPAAGSAAVPEGSSAGSAGSADSAGSAGSATTAEGSAAKPLPDWAMGKPEEISREAIDVVDELAAKHAEVKDQMLSEDCAVAATAMKQLIPLSVRLGNATDELDAVSKGKVPLVTWAKTFYIPHLQEVLNDVGATIQMTKCRKDPDFKAAALEYTKTNTGEIPTKKPE